MALGFVYICQRFDKWYLKSFIYLLPISHMYSAQKRILWYTLWGTWAAKLLLWLCGTQCSILSILTSFKGHDVMQNIIIYIYFKDHWQFWFMDEITPDTITPPKSPRQNHPCQNHPYPKSPLTKITPAHNHPYPKSPLKNSPLPKITPAQYHPCRWITPTQNHPCRWITSGLKPNYLT